MENIEIVEFLLCKGANINASYESGYTPLHSAVLGNHTEIVNILLKNGANSNAANDHGKTPLNIAAEIGQYRNC